MILRSGFRAKLIAVTTLPHLAVLLVVLFVVLDATKKEFEERSRESIVIGGSVVTEYLASRAVQLRTSVDVLAADFALKETVLTADIETIRSVLDNHVQRLHADIALLLDNDRQAIVTLGSSGTLPTRNITKLVEPGVGRLPLSVIRADDGALYQIFAARLRAPTTIGWLVVGFEIDSRVVQRMATLTGFDIVVVDTTNRDVLLVSDSFSDSDSSTMVGLASDMRSGDNSYYLEDGRREFLAHSVGIGAKSGGVQIVLLRTVQKILLPYENARRIIVRTSLLLLAVVLILAFWIATGIANPLRELTHVARQFAAGKYGTRVKRYADKELDILASSLDVMRTEIAERESRLKFHATRDVLTGLPNRRSFVESAQSEIDGTRVDCFAVLVVRLSRINRIASTMGYEIVNELTKLVAERLIHDLAANDVLGHTGHNEFSMLLFNRDRKEALAHAESIANLIASGLVLGKTIFGVKVAVGIALYPRDSSDSDTLLRHAVAAATEARWAGKDVAIFESELAVQQKRQLTIVNDFRHAIDSQEIEVHYQPKMELASGAVCGAEALVRWKHPEYGQLAPDEFISAAEDAGIIRYLTHYVLKQAFVNCRDWQLAGYLLQVSVNVSAHDLEEEYLPHYIKELANEYGVTADRITVEVTENAVLRNLSQAISVLESLQNIGVRTSIDDFGTGHSSLSQLKNIPIHELKIDRSFTQLIFEDRSTRAVVDTILQLADTMNLDVVAEGVEDQQTLDLLLERNCQQIQGYFLSKALPSIDFIRWLKQRK